ncbi:MAG: leucine-rich repeat domain-containing protein, partial [Tannerellaceae bacterium]|nr:leucine-rich repeat domain-containing protein [Tannerellaceae bacterium]
MKKVIDKFRIDAKHRVYTVRPLRRTFAAAVIFAAICLLSSFAAVPAYADNIASGTDWTFADDGTVTITSDAGMTDWVTWQQSNYEQRANVTAAVIGNAVTTVDAVAFYSCNNLASVTFEATSSVTAIGVLAFGYTALQTIEIPASVTSIGAAAFTTTPLT